MESLKDVSPIECPQLLHQEDGFFLYIEVGNHRKVFILNNNMHEVAAPLKDCLKGMAYNKLHYFVIATSLLILVALFVTYGWAVYMDHVSPLFPYISMTSSLPPESCVFSEMFTLASIIMILLVYLRYRQVSELVSQKILPKWKNLTTAWIGFIATIGFNMVANFQVYNISSIHLTGAGGCIIFSTVYFCLQSWISYKMSPRIHKNWVLHFRTALSIMCIIFTLSTIMFGMVSVNLFPGTLEDQFYWKKEQSGYICHLISCFSEYLLVICYCIYLFTFIKDLSIMKIHSPKIEIDVPIIGNSL